MSIIRIGRNIIFMSAMLAPALHAGQLASENNTASITINGDRSDWAGLNAFPDDTAGEAGIGPFDVDWQNLTIANSPDQATIYLRYRMNNGADFNSFPAFYNLYIDADQDRGTGYIGGGSQLSIGADYLIQGASLYEFTGGGSQTAFSWGFLAALTSDNSFANLDITMSLSSSDIGNPELFDVVLLGDNGLNGNTPDYDPDGGELAAAGDYYEYRMALVTEDDAAIVSAGVVASMSAFLVTNTLTNITYRLEAAPATNNTAWALTGYEVPGTGGDVLLFDPAGYTTERVYRVSGAYDQEP